MRNSKPQVNHDSIVDDWLLVHGQGRIHVQDNRRCQKCACLPSCVLDRGGNEKEKSLREDR